jgi:Secretion system C-terminal sorting domain
MNILIMCFCEVRGQYVYFNELYGVDHPETTTAIEVLPDGYVTASAQNNEGVGTLLLRKYDWNGEVLAENSVVSEPELNYFYVHGQAALKRLSSDGLIYSGLFETSTEIYTRVFLLNNDLDTIWTSKVTLPEYNNLDLTVSLEVSDGYLFFGYVQYDIDRDIICVKLNSSGEYQWHWVLEDSSKSNTPLMSIETGDGDFLIGGTTELNGYSDGWVKRVAVSGVEKWNHNLGNTNMADGYIQSIVSLPNGHWQTAYGHAISGSPDLPNHEWRSVEFGGESDYQEYGNFSFNTFWLSGVSKQIIASPTKTVMSGTYFPTENSIDGIVMQTNNMGSVDWLNYYSYQSCSTCNNVMLDMEHSPDGGYICSGYFIDYSEAIPINKTWLLKIDACGEVAYNGCPPSVNVVEAGSKEQQLVLWPNPAQDVLHLDGDPGVEVISFSLIDIAGQRLLTQAINHFTGTAVVDVSAIPAGYYLAEIKSANGKTSVFRVVLNGSVR